MKFFDNLKLRFSPPRFLDPEFGELIYMYIPANPSESYWEGEHWSFAHTKTEIAVFLPGDESGPLPQGRDFLLGIADRYEEALSASVLRLREVFTEYLNRSLPQDIFSEVKLVAIGIEDVKTTPISWDISFETTGDDWLGIKIPFVGMESQPAVVDT